ncbi:MAG: hypothetical protein WKG01_30025 [Kofleriaceae bacterium]
MRLGILDTGHSLAIKAVFAFIRRVSRHPVPDVVKTLRYRPELFGNATSELFQEVMRGPSEWSIADRELMAAYVSKTNECEF